MQDPFSYDDPLGHPGVEPTVPPAWRPTYLDGLNPVQREAVETLDGPVLVLAGAGTGKTRVLTTRIAHLLMTRRAAPWQVLAVTFTNKAAREMRDRIEALIGQPAEGWWLGTFHALAARILRRHAELVGLRSNFTILDTDDQLRLVKQILQAESVDDKKWPARSLLGVIERWKDRGLTPDRLKAEDAGDVAGGRLIAIYRAYQARLTTLNACDFGDLLLHNLTLFQNHPDVLAEYHRRFRYVLVDEYQDTNVAQYLWLRLLAQGHKNICCVGDDDQCLAEGTLVRMADGSEKPIEAVTAGDAVLSATGGGAFGASFVTRTHCRERTGNLVEIELDDGARLVSTPEHRHFAGYRLGEAPRLYFTYLMHKRGYGFRLGTSQTYTRGQVDPVMGYELRCRQEHGDAVWLLATHDSETEARFLEHTLSLDYGISTFPFVARAGRSTNGLVHDQTLLDGIFRDRPSEEAGARLLERFGLDRAFPHYRPQAHTGRRRNVTVTLCGERRGASPLHRISVIGGDAADAERLAAIGLSVRSVKKGNPGWCYETAMADLSRMMEIVERIREVFDGDVSLVQMGRFGRGEADAPSSSGTTGGEDELAVLERQVVRVRSSLPMLPASSVRIGMSMFRADGGMATVRSIRTVPGPARVYDLDVGRTHNYVANGVVTHNSIYGWRGAEVGNILRFEQDFPGARTIRLEQNYRSTGHILSAASGVIAHNQGRLGKTLWTSADAGDRVRVRAVWDGEEEARWIGDEIEALQRAQVPLDKVAVLVRAGFQTREFEERFITLGLPYRVVGGLRFYERQEIRDALAYFRVIGSPADDLAFERIVNVPKRGIGPATMQQITRLARADGIAMTEAAWKLCQTDELKPKMRSTLRGLLDDFFRWQGLAATMSHTDLAQLVLDESGYTAMWQADKTPEAPGRLENLKELVAAMAEFENLPGFLEHVSLVMDANESAGGEMATLMTLHGAKGLEFDYVFLPGWEEGVFPNQRALDETGIAGLEEERRLAYVGLTRARRRAYVSHAANRRIHGTWTSTVPSRFVEELPDGDIETEAATGLHAGGFGAARDMPGFGPGFGVHGGGFGSGGWAKSPPRQPPGRNLVIEGSAHEVTPRARPKAPFGRGDRVFHRKFGYGTVAAVDADKLEIAFDHAGTKKVLDSFVVPADQAD